MSFGFSIGDFFAVGKLAWSVYKSCKEAGGAFVELSYEVIALHTAIKELEDEIENPNSILNRTGANKKTELVLQQLNQKLIKYKSLGTASRRTWDRLRFGAGNLQEVRDKLLTHTSSLTLFLTTLGTGSLGRIEKKLDQLIEDVRLGRREETVLTFAHGEDDPDEAETRWSLLKGELVDDGFSKPELEGHKHWIKAKLTELIESGCLEEKAVPEHTGARKAAQDSPRPPSYAEKEGEVLNILKTSSMERRKSPNTADVPQKASAFQPTVEDVDEEIKKTQEDILEIIEENRAPKDATGNLQESDKGTEEEGAESEEYASSAVDNSDSEIVYEQPRKFLKKSTDYKRLADQEKRREAGRQKQEEDKRVRETQEKDVKRAVLQGKKKTRDKERRKGFEAKQPKADIDDSSDGTNDTFQATILPTDSVSQVGSGSTPRNISSGYTTGYAVPSSSTNEYTSRPPKIPRAQTFKHASPANPPRRNHTLAAVSESDGSDDDLPPSRRPNRHGSTRYIINERSVPIGRSRATSPATQNIDDQINYDYYRRDDRFSSLPPRRQVNTKRHSTPNARSGDVRNEQENRHRPPEGLEPVILTARPKMLPREPIPPLPRGQTFPVPPPLPRAATFQTQPPYPGFTQSRSQGQEFNTGNLGQGGGGFNFSNPEDIFAEFLRGQPTQPRPSGPNDEILNEFAHGYAAATAPPPQMATPPVTVVERPVRLSLEELFHGCHKKMKIKRKVFDDETGRRTTEDKILEFNIKPGLKKGSKIKFKDVGASHDTGEQQDLHFIVEEKEHVLTREGDNLHLTVEIHLVDSLCGFKRTVATIDGKMIDIEKDGPTEPESEDTFPGLGMPLSKKPEERGNFIVKYRVRYPQALDKRQKVQLRQILYDSKTV